MTDDPTDPDMAMDMVGSDDPSVSDSETTRPLPPRFFPPPAAEEEEEELTRPLPPSHVTPVPSRPGRGPSRATLPSASVLPRPVAVEAKIPVVVSAPPPSRGSVEHAPSILIAQRTPRPAPALASAPPPPADVAPLPRRGRSSMPTLPPQSQPPLVPSVPPVAGTIPPPPSPERTARSLAIVAVAAAAVVLALIGLRLRPGSLVVTASAEGEEPPSAVTFFLDGQARCQRSPCDVTGLAPGTYLVSASAPGFARVVERAILVEPGKHAAHHVALVREAPQPASLTVSAAVPGSHVWVDGTDRGETPATVTDLLAGQHSVRVTGPEHRYRAYDDIMTLEAGERRSLGPVRLEPIAEEPTRESPVAPIPVPATPVVVLAAAPVAAPVHVVSALRPPAATRTAGHAARSGVRAAGAPEPAAAEGASLDIGSEPPAAVVVNGRPLGMTPLHGVHVEPGPQTVVFIHPELGRKVSTVNVTPGGTRAVSVTF